jgi:all-trans-retinol 13,14-reductase
MHPGVSWKQKPPTGPFDAIVIGSGIGGLSCASALARYAHRRVLVLERHYRIGGYTQTFTRPGYEWDVGVHYMGEMSPTGGVRRVFDRLTDGSLEWAPLPPVYDRVLLGERAYDFVAGKEKFIEQMSAYFPSERRAIVRYVELCQRANRHGPMFFADRVIPGWLSLIAGSLLRRGYLDWARRTTGEVLSELTANQELISVLTGQYGNYGLPPSRSSFVIHAAVMNHYLEGGWYPVGGSAAIARVFAPVIEKEGGVLCHSVEVEKVIVENGRAAGVALEDGTVLRAPVIVSAAGVANTYRRLLPSGTLPAQFEGVLQRCAPSVGYMCLYLGFKHSDRELGLTGTNLWIYPNGAHDQNLETFAADPARPLPVVYASFPSAKDPSWPGRFPGRSTLELLTVCPWEWVEKWKDSRWHQRGPEYEEFKAGFSQRLIEVIYRALPHLRGKVDVAELSTPVSTQHFTAHPKGELYGLDHSPTRYSAQLRAQSPIPGLFLTGADLVSVGVAGAMMGGALTASAIEGLSVLREVLKSA